MSVKVKFWVAGVLLAAIGLVLARVVSGRYADRGADATGDLFCRCHFGYRRFGLILFGMRKSEARV